MPLVGRRLAAERSGRTHAAQAWRISVTHDANGDSMAAWYFDLISPFSWLALPEVEALPGQVEYTQV